MTDTYGKYESRFRCVADSCRKYLRAGYETVCPECGEYQIGTPPIIEIGRWCQRRDDENIIYAEDWIPREFVTLEMGQADALRKAQTALDGSALVIVHGRDLENVIAAVDQRNAGFSPWELLKALLEKAGVRVPPKKERREKIVGWEWVNGYSHFQLVADGSPVGYVREVSSPRGGARGPRSSFSASLLSELLGNFDTIQEAQSACMEAYRKRNESLQQ